MLLGLWFVDDKKKDLKTEVLGRYLYPSIFAMRK